MSKQNKKLLVNVVLTLVLIIVARALRLLINDMTTVILPTFLIYLRSVVHLSLALVWTMSVYSRITNKHARRFVLSVGILMIFWIVVKTAKYEYLDNTDTLVRYLWYCFYIPMLLIPLIGIFVAQYIRKPDDYRLPKWSYLFYIPAFLLLCGIFTNDFHNLMFAFPKGIEKFDSNYTYGILYWVSMAWYVSLTLAFVVTLIVKSRLPGSKSMQMIPLVIAIVAVVFWILYTAGLIEGDLTVIDCIIIGTLLETSIQTGLIPTNTSHKELFAQTTVSVIIVDENYQARYTSGGAIPVSEEVMKETENGVVVLGNTIVSSTPIRAGKVVWEDDVTELNNQWAELDEIREELLGESVLIQAETEIKEKQAQADEKNRLYDKIARDVKPQLAILSGLLDKIEKGEFVKENMARVAIVGSYVKRRGNLLFIGNENGEISIREMDNAFRESLDNLKLLGIENSLMITGKNDIRLDCAINVYDLYEKVIEIAMDSITAIFVRLVQTGDKLKFSIELGTREGINEEALKSVTSDGELSIEIDDGDVYVDYITGGESK